MHTGLAKSAFFRGVKLQMSTRQTKNTSPGRSAQIRITQRLMMTSLQPTQPFVDPSAVDFRSRQPTSRDVSAVGHGNC